MGALTESRYATVTISTLQGLASWLERKALPTQHLTAGVSEHAEALVIPRDKDHQYDERTVAINRTNDDLPFPSGRGADVHRQRQQGPTRDDGWCLAGSLRGVSLTLAIYTILQCTSSSSLVAISVRPAPGSPGCTGSTTSQTPPTFREHWRPCTSVSASLDTTGTRRLRQASSCPAHWSIWPCRSHRSPSMSVPM